MPPRRHRLTWQDILERHQQRFPHSGLSSLVELLLKLAGFAAPQLQGLEPLEQRDARPWLARLAPAFSVAVLDAASDRQAFLRRELRSGRPVGLWYPEPDRRGWAVVDLIEIPPHCFVELWSKAPEKGAGEGRYSEKRRILLGSLREPVLPTVVYLHAAGPLFPQIARRLLPSSACDSTPSSL